MADLIGHSLGRYHILEQLGEGGMAIVYKAFDTRLERYVAIKVILAQKQETGKFRKRFEREARALAQLTHPNIVGIIDYGEYEGMPYLVMEYLPSGTLKRRLGSPIPYREAAKILAPIARALAYAHDQKIIHRDIKPANILITQSGEPMLSDFGIAKILETEETAELTATGVGIGTPEYMSPEQAQGKIIDNRSDVYSLGVVFFEMVTGRKPYQADTPVAVIWKLASEPLPRPKQFVSDLPDIVEAILLKALAKNPEDRYPDMGTFAAALEGLASAQKAEKISRPMESPPFRAYAPTGRKKATRRWLPITLGIMLLAVMATAGIAIFRLGQLSTNRSDLSTITPLPAASSVNAPTETRTKTPLPTNTPTDLPTDTPAPTPAISLMTPSPKMIRADNAASLQLLSEFPTDSWLESVVFSPDGKYLASAGADGIFLYDLAQNKVFQHLTGHNGQVHSVVFNPAGTLLYSGGVDIGGGKIRVWDWMNGIQVYETASIPPEPWGTGAAISPDGTEIVTDGALALTLWQTSGNELVSPQQLTSGCKPVFSPDGKSLGFFRDTQGLVLYNLRSRAEKALTAVRGNGFCPKTSFSPDGLFVASGSLEGSVYVWQASNQTQIQKLTGHSGAVEVVTFSPDSSMLASGGMDDTVRIWRVSDGEALLVLKAGTGGFNSLVFSPDGSLLAGGSKFTTLVWGLP